MSLSLGTLEIGLGLNTSQYDSGIKSAKDQLSSLEDHAQKITREIEWSLKQSIPKLAIVPLVDHRPLHGLNKHLSEKEKHIDRVSKKAIKIKVDDKELQKIANKTVIVQAKVQSNGSVQKYSDEVKQKVEVSTKNANLELLTEIKAVTKEIKEVVKAVSKLKPTAIGSALSTVGSSLVQGVAFNATKNFGKGLMQSIDNQIADTLGSTSLVAKQIVDNFFGGINQSIDFAKNKLDAELGKPDKKQNKNLIEFLSIFVETKEEISDSLSSFIDSEKKELEKFANTAKKERQNRKKSSDANQGMLFESQRLYRMTAAAETIAGIQSKYQKQSQPLQQQAQIQQQAFANAELKVAELEDKRVTALSKIKQAKSNLINSDQAKAIVSLKKELDNIDKQIQLVVPGIDDLYAEDLNKQKQKVFSQLKSAQSALKAQKSNPENLKNEKTITSLEKELQSINQELQLAYEQLNVVVDNLNSEEAIALQENIQKITADKKAEFQSVLKAYQVFNVDDQQSVFAMAEGLNKATASQSIVQESEQKIKELNTIKRKIEQKIAEITQKLQSNLPENVKKDLSEIRIKLTKEYEKINKDLTLAENIQNKEASTLKKNVAPFLDAKNKSVEVSQRIKNQIDLTSYNSLITDVLKSVTDGQIPDANNFPAIVPDDRVRNVKKGSVGTNAVYNAETNTIKLDTDSYRRVMSGNATTEDIRTLAHEMTHAVDAGFGKFQNIASMITGNTNLDNQFADNITADLRKFVQQYDSEKERPAEFQAEGQAREKANEIIQKQYEKIGVRPPEINADAVKSQIFALSNLFNEIEKIIPELIDDEAIKIAQEELEKSRKRSLQMLESFASFSSVIRKLNLTTLPKPDAKKFLELQISIKETEAQALNLKNEIIQEIKNINQSETENSTASLKTPDLLDNDSLWASMGESIDNAVETAGEVISSGIQRVAQTFVDKLDEIATNQINNILLQPKDGVIDLNAPQIGSVSELGLKEVLALTKIGTQQALTGINQGFKTLLPAIKTGYGVLQGTENFALNMLPFGHTAKGIAKNIALPAAAFGMATHALPGGTAVAEGLTNLLGGATSPLINGIAGQVTEVFAGQLSSIPIIGGHLSALATQGISGAAGIISSGVAEAGTAILGGQVLLNTSGQAAKAVLSGENRQELSQLPSSTAKISSQTELALEVAGDNLKSLALAAQKLEKELRSQLTGVTPQLKLLGTNTNENYLNLLPERKRESFLKKQREYEQALIKYEQTENPITKIPTPPQLSKTDKQTIAKNLRIEDLQREVSYVTQNADALRKASQDAIDRVNNLLAKVPKNERFGHPLASLLGNLTQLKESAENVNPIYDLKKLGVNKEILGAIDVKSQVIPEMTDTGSNIVSGLVQGLNSKLAQLETVSIDIASTPLEITKQINKIQSPSKEFEEIGKNIVEGEIKGIKSKEKDLQATMAIIAKNMIENRYLATKNPVNIDPFFPRQIEAYQKQSPNTFIGDIQLGQEKIRGVSYQGQSISQVNQKAIDQRLALEAENETNRKATNKALTEASKYTAKIRELSEKEAERTRKEKAEKEAWAKSRTQQLAPVIASTETLDNNKIKTKKTEEKLPLYTPSSIPDPWKDVHEIVRPIPSKPIFNSYEAMAKKQVEIDNQILLNIKKQLQTVEKKVQVLKKSGQPTNEIEKMLAESAKKSEELFLKEITKRSAKKAEEIYAETIKKFKQKALPSDLSSIPDPWAQESTSKPTTKTPKITASTQSQSSGDGMPPKPPKPPSDASFVSKPEPSKKSSQDIEARMNALKQQIEYEQSQEEVGSNNKFKSKSINRTEDALNKYEQFIEQEILKSIENRSTGLNDEELNQLLKRLKNKEKELDKIIDYIDRQNNITDVIDSEFGGSFQLPNGMGPIDDGFGFKEFFQTLRQNNPVIDKTINLIKRLFISFIGAELLQSAGMVFRQFAAESFQSALNMERLETALNFSTGNAESSLTKLKIQADRLGTSFLSSAKNYQQFSASVMNTPLEFQKDKIFEGITLGLATRGANSQQQDRALLAVTQIASKGRVSLEEISGQMAEALPGSVQIAARSMGLTSQEFIKLVESGAVASDEFLSKFATQTALESAGGINAINDTAFAQVARFQNQMESFRISLGEPLLEATKLGLPSVTKALKALTENGELVATVLASIGIVTVGSFVMVLKNLGLIDLALKALGITAKTTGGSISQIGVGLLKGLGWTALIYGVMEAFKGLYQYINAGSEESKRSLKSTQESLQELRRLLEKPLPTPKASTVITDSATAIQQFKNNRERDKSLEFTAGGLSDTTQILKLSTDTFSDTKITEFTGKLDTLRQKAKDLKIDEIIASGDADVKKATSVRQEIAKVNQEIQALTEKYFPQIGLIVNEIASTEERITAIKKVLDDPESSKSQKDNASIQLEVAETQFRKLKESQEKYNEAVKENLINYQRLTEQINKVARDLSNIEFISSGRTILSETDIKRQVLSGNLKPFEIDLTVKEQSLSIVKDQFNSLNGLLATKEKELQNTLTDQINQRITELMPELNGIDFRTALQQGSVSPEAIGDRLQQLGDQAPFELKQVLETAKQQASIRRQTLTIDKSIVDTELEIANARRERARNARQASIVGANVNERIATLRQLPLGGPVASYRDALSEVRNQERLLEEAYRRLEGASDDPSVIQQEVDNTRLALEQARANLLQQQTSLQDYYRNLDRQIIDFNRQIEDYRRQIEDAQLSAFKENRSLSESYGDLVRELDKSLLNAQNQLLDTTDRIRVQQVKNRLLIPGTSDAGKELGDIFLEFVQGQADIASRGRTFQSRTEEIETSYISTLRNIRNLQEQQQEAERNRLRTIEDIKRTQENLNRTLADLIRQTNQELGFIPQSIKDIVTNLNTLPEPIKLINSELVAIPPSIKISGEDLVKSIEETAEAIRKANEQISQPLVTGQFDSNLLPVPFLPKSRNGYLPPPPQSQSSSQSSSIPNGLTRRGQELSQHLENPYVKAFLDTIAYAEGTANMPNKGYNTLFGHGQFSSFTDHPRQRIPFGSTSSSASGRYQIMDFTWDEEKSKLGLKDFSPVSQDLVALSRILMRGGLDELLKGDIRGAINATRKEWASFPGANYPGQGMKRMEDLLKVYEQSLRKYQPNAPRTQAELDALQYDGNPANSGALNRIRQIRRNQGGQGGPEFSSPPPIAQIPTLPNQNQDNFWDADLPPVPKENPINFQSPNLPPVPKLPTDNLGAAAGQIRNAEIADQNSQEFLRRLEERQNLNNALDRSIKLRRQQEEDARTLERTLRDASENVADLTINSKGYLTVQEEINKSATEVSRQYRSQIESLEDQRRTLLLNADAQKKYSDAIKEILGEFQEKGIALPPEFVKEMTDSIEVLAKNAELAKEQVATLDQAIEQLSKNQGVATLEASFRRTRDTVRSIRDRMNDLTIQRMKLENQSRPTLFDDSAILAERISLQKEKEELEDYLEPYKDLPQYAEYVANIRKEWSQIAELRLERVALDASPNRGAAESFFSDIREGKGIGSAFSSLGLNILTKFVEGITKPAIDALTLAIDGFTKPITQAFESVFNAIIGPVGSFFNNALSSIFKPSGNIFSSIFGGGGGGGLFNGLLSGITGIFSGGLGGLGSLGSIGASSFASAPASAFSLGTGFSLFSDGGKVGKANAPIEKNIISAFQRERAMSGGRKPRLIVANEDELVLNPKETEAYLEYRNNAPIKNYANGGFVGGKPNYSTTSNNNNSNQSLVINNTNNVTVESRNDMGYSLTQLKERENAQNERTKKRFFS